MITDAMYANSEHTSISATIDGKVATIPVDLGNRHYREIQDKAIPVLNYTPPILTTQDVRNEAERRIILFLSARDLRHAIAIQLNTLGAGGAEAVAMTTGINDIRTASNVMESSPPADYADAANWP